MPQHVGPLRPYRDTSPQLGERIMIDPSSVVIGHVTLGDDVSIWPLAAIRGDVNRVHQYSGRLRITRDPLLRAQPGGTSPDYRR